MNDENLIRLLNTLAEEYVFMDTKDLDIPTAGKLLNQLEPIVDEAERLKVNPVRNCASAMSQILEKTILDGIEDKAGAANVFEVGIHLMQKIADSFHDTGKYNGSIREFLEQVSAVAGVAGSTSAPDSQSEQKEAEVQETKCEGTPSA